MKKRKILAVLLTLLMITAVLAGCGNNDTGGTGDAEEAPADDKVYTFRIGALVVEPNQCVTTANEFKTRIEAASEGRVAVEVYPAAQLGTAAQLLEGMQNGSIQGGMFPAEYAISTAPLLGYIALPDVIGDNSYDFCKLQNDSGNVMLNEYMNQFGLHIAGWMVADEHKTILMSTPFATGDDLAGKKLWCFPNVYDQNLTKALKATPANFDPSEIVVSLQQGTIDGVMAGDSLYVPMKQTEYAKYHLTLDTYPRNLAFFMSAPYLSSLPEDLKELVLDVAMETLVEYEYDYALMMDGKYKQGLVDAGVTELEMTPELKAAVDQASGEILNMYLENEGAQEFLDNIKALAQ